MAMLLGLRAGSGEKRLATSAIPPTLPQRVAGEIGTARVQGEESEADGVSRVPAAPKATKDSSRASRRELGKDRPHGSQPLAEEVEEKLRGGMGSWGEEAS